MSTQTPDTPDLPLGIAGPALPQILRAGDSWKWCAAFANYAPTDGWALQYVLNSPTGSFFAFPNGVATADDSGNGFVVTLTSEQTAKCAAGRYDCYAVLSNSTTSEQQTIPLESVKVEPNIAAATVAVDTRSFAKRTLDVIEAAIAGNASPDVMEYQIHGSAGAGRMVRRIPPAELMQLREYFRNEYRNERIAAGEFVPKTVARISF